MAILYWTVYAASLAIGAGGVVFCVLVLIATRRYRREAAFVQICKKAPPPISILKPLAGLEDSLEHNLETFFRQDYPEYEVLFAVREPGDPAAEVARRLMARYPQIPSELIVTGEPEYPNAKVYSLSRMSERARHGILVVSDSDIRATPDYLRRIAAEFADPKVGVTTCPYRALPGRSFWSGLEGLTLNTEFWGGVLVARMLEGMHFAVGPTMALRRSYLDAVGGFDATGEYLAEDFVLGQWAEKHGYRATLAAHVVDHCIGAQAFRANLRHRIRWARSTRRSRPAGYIGQVFTNPLPFALVLAVGPAAPLALLILVARIAAAGALSFGILRDPLTRRYWWLIPVADVASLIVWVLGFFGNTVDWRGRKYRLLPDGRFQAIS